MTPFLLPLDPANEPVEKVSFLKPLLLLDQK
jgi:hypothetical protein